MNGIFFDVLEDILAVQMSRWDAYTSAQEAAINKIKCGLKLSRFINNLPPAISKDKAFCESLHEHFVAKSVESIRANFASVESSVNLRSHLDQLDTLEAEKANQAAYGGAWRPSDSAKDNQADHDKSCLSDASKRIERDVLESLENDIAQLEQRVVKFSDSLDTNAGQIDAFISNTVA